MKIKTRRADIDRVLSIEPPKHKRPKRPNIAFRTLIRALSVPDMIATGFTYTRHNMDSAGEGPYLILMNHSCFLDLEIASKILWPMPYCIVCTSDGFVGKEWLMRRIGCIPTKKFVTDLTLVSDIIHTLKKEKTSVLMYPEASYSFDGRATPLPRHMGKLIKRLNVPVVTIITEGAFLHNPLYNCLQKRKTKVSARLSCLITKEELTTLSAGEIDSRLDAAFSFDNFARQLATETKITEPFRADGLNRILYKCAACGTEGKMTGKGTELFCAACGKRYFMDELGRLSARSGKTEFSHIPDWYDWERECVRRELENGTYRLDTAVDISIMADFKAIYSVGRGRLTHSAEGFRLTGFDGKLDYRQSPQSSYGLYADYYWYEIGDVICIGNSERLYYCFPHEPDVAARTRLAAEELFKLTKNVKKPSSGDPVKNEA